MKPNKETTLPRLYRLLLGALSLLLLGGCALGKQSTPSRYYVLSSLPEKTELLNTNGALVPTIGVGRVEIPSYLDRPQIVRRIGENELKANEFQRWAEPLSDSTTRVLRENLSELLGPDKVTAFPWLTPFKSDYEIHVVILRYEPLNEMREVELRVFWRLMKSDDREPFNISEKTYRKSIVDPVQDYAHVVQSMSDVWSDLSRDVARALLELPEKAPETE